MYCLLLIPYSWQKADGANFGGVVDEMFSSCLWREKKAAYHRETSHEKESESGGIYRILFGMNGGHVALQAPWPRWFHVRRWILTLSLASQIGAQLVRLQPFSTS